MAAAARAGSPPSCSPEIYVGSLQPELDGYYGNANMRLYRRVMLVRTHNFTGASVWTKSWVSKGVSGVLRGEPLTRGAGTFSGASAVLRWSRLA